MEVFVAGIGICGPGFSGWPASREVLAGETPWAEAPLQVPAATLLAANERRRAGPVTRLALAVAQEAVAMSGLEPGRLRSVFGSANGDGAVLHAILDALTRPEMEVSPMQFHNSVHNAPAGYWSIGAGARNAATCLGVHDDTAAAALLKAAAEVRATRCPVLLCLYDMPLQPPLSACRPTGFGFGEALVLLPEPAPGTVGRLSIGFAAAPPEPGLVRPRGEAAAALWGGNPAARLLRLLEALAAGGPDKLAIPLQQGCVTVEVAA